MTLTTEKADALRTIGESFPPLPEAGSARRQAGVRCREIRPADFDTIIDLLTYGFATSREYWAHALKRLTDHATPTGFPKYGYMLESDGRPVGALLLIFTAMGDSPRIRCNVSSWYVAPEFRSYAPLLARHATRRKDVTYFNLTPASMTRRILEAEGYSVYARGRFVALPVFSSPWPKVRVREADFGRSEASDHLSHAEIRLLLDHVGYGCTSLICEVPGEQHPFVFAHHRRWAGLSAARLVYCRDCSDFIRFAGPLGRFLARRGYFLVSINGNGPLPGLIGSYKDNWPNFCKGAHPMSLGDIAYSELVMFGTWSNDWRPQA
jgi:hypothetical protein